MKYTPGPWTYDGICYIWGPKGEMIADDGIPDEQEMETIRLRGVGAALPMEANAHLIAAAPELLEACRSVHKSINTKYTGNTALKILLKQAIDKAVQEASSGRRGC